MTDPEGGRVRRHDVLVYAHDASETACQPSAQAVLAELWRSRSGALSTQVLQEFYVVATRKYDPPMSRREARDLVDAYSNWQLVQIDVPLILAASQLEEGHTLSFRDALIVEAARRAAQPGSSPKTFRPGGGHHAEARADTQLVKIFWRGALIKFHPRQPPGGRSTDPDDLPAGRNAGAGIDIRIVSERLNHSSTHTTREIYTRPTPPNRATLLNAWRSSSTDRERRSDLGSVRRLGCHARDGPNRSRSTSG